MLDNQVSCKTVREQIIDRLRTEILTGQLPGGQRMLEVELAQRFRLSRGPIRDALLQLTAEGLLEAKPNCGATVAEPPTEDIRATIIKMRRMLEVFAGKLLSRTITEGGIAQLRAQVLLHREACQKGDMTQVVRHDLRFHEMLFELAERPELIGLWRPIVLRMRLPYSRHKNLEESAAEHEKIVDALEARDAKAVAQALEGNIC